MTVDQLRPEQPRDLLHHPVAAIALSPRRAEPQPGAGAHLPCLFFPGRSPSVLWEPVRVLSIFIASLLLWLSNSLTSPL